MNYDLIIIGGGPGGYYAAQLALNENKSVLLFEQHKLGGVCLNYGCIPSKSLLYNAKMYHLNKNTNNLAYDLSNLIYDQTKAINIKNYKVTQLRNALEKTLKLDKCEIIFSKATIKSKTGELFQIESEQKLYQSKNVIIATGSSVFLPPIKGIENFSKFENFLTSKEALDLKTLPKKIVIVGGGVIALEMASYFMQLECEVVIMQRNEQILKLVDFEIANKLKSYLEKSYKVKFILNIKFIEVNENEIKYEQENQIKSESFDKILFATGRKSNVNNIGLENLNVESDYKKIVTNLKMETNIPNLYAIGDVKGHTMLAHCAYREAEVALDQINGKKTYMDYNLVPNVIFTNPEIATIGLSQEQAKSQNLKFYVKKSSLL